MFKKCIVRKPCENMIKGITTANLGVPSYEDAIKQHNMYIDSLEQTGVKVTVLEPYNEFPDSCFVEDVAVVADDLAIITRPGANSRKQEIELIRSVLKEEFKYIEEITSPGTLEGGDIMMVDKHFYIGRSNRTNEEGASQFLEIIKKYGYDGTIVPFDDGLLHLKTGMTYLSDNNLLITKRFMNYKEFEKFNRILIDTEEEYASNCIFNNGKVIMPKGFNNTKEKVMKLGYEIIDVPMTEFEKIDGGLTCLSLRY